MATNVAQLPAAMMVVDREPAEPMAQRVDDFEQLVRSLTAEALSDVILAVGELALQTVELVNRGEPLGQRESLEGDDLGLGFPVCDGGAQALRESGASARARDTAGRVSRRGSLLPPRLGGASD
jgi:hypothetical protein